jgi:ArsR family transcriptional regulator
LNQVNIFKALADPTRLKILECIKDREKCVCEVIPYSGKSQPNVSQHLKVLKTAGLINERREGTRILIKASNQQIFKIIDSIKKLE